MDVIYATVEDLQVVTTSAPHGSSIAVLMQAQRPLDGHAMFVNPDDLLSASAVMAPAIRAPDARQALFERRGGYPRRGPGRKKGSGRDVRVSLHQVLFVLVSTSAYLKFSEFFDPSKLINVDLEEQRNLRQQLSMFTYEALRTRAWDLSRSGAVVVLVKYGRGGSRNDRGRHLAVAVVASLKKNSVACTCRVFGTFLTSTGAECKNRWERHSKRCGQLFL